MKVRTELPELVGYQIAGDAQTCGPLTTCLVEAAQSGRLFAAEWVDAASSSESLYARVAREWQQNTSRQPQGSLFQHEFVDSGKRLTRVIELPRGRPLVESLFQRRWGLADSVATAIELTSCLADWHACDRVHGRLGHECIYRDPRGKIELREVLALDGHVQRDFLSLPAQEVIFYSPESSGSLAREISPASDLYTVGVVLFTMLAARPPIVATSASNYLDRQLCVEPPRLRELGLQVPRALDDLVARLLRRDPRDRYETSTGLLYDLQYIARSLGSSDSRDVFAIGTDDVRLALTESTLVGRETEIETLGRALDEARSGQGSLQLVTASEATSRRNLLDEIALCAKSEGMFVFRGGGLSGSPKPLQCLETVLSQIDSSSRQDQPLATRIASATAEHADTLSMLLPSLAPLWPPCDAPTGPAEHGSRRTAVAIETLLTAFTVESPGVALLLDDLDLADELTCTVVRPLIERLSLQPDNCSLCIVASAESIEALDLPSVGQAIHLGPVSSKALELHLRSSAGRLSRVITRSIIEVAQGSTSMASAILGRMIDLGVVTPSKQGWLAEGRLTEALRGDESIAELLERQVGALSASALDILSAAAVVGQHFELPMLARVTGASYADVLQVATDALGRRLLWRDSRAGWFRFAHDHIHQQLQLRLDETGRQQLHLAAAAYIEEHDRTNVFALALHYDQAGDGPKALKTSLQAAHQAQQQYSLSVAQEQLLIAKRWVPIDDHETGLQIAESLGEILLLSGRYDQAAPYLREALRLAHTPLEKARVQQLIGELAFKRGRLAEAATEYEHALVMTGVVVPSNFVSMLCSLVTQTFFQVIHTWLPRPLIARRGQLSPLDCLRLQLLSRLSRVYWFSRHRLWPLSNHLRSLNEAERFAASETLASVYSEHGPGMSLLRWFSRANRYCQRSYEIRKATGNVWGQGQSLHYHSVVMLAECRFHDAIETSTRAVDLLRKMGDFWEMNMARYQTANALYRSGRFHQAATLAAEIFHSGREIGDIQATGISLDVWARTEPQTLPLEIVTEEAARSRPDAQSNAQTQLAFAVTLMHHNRIDEAIRTLEEAIAQCEQAGHLNTYISPCYAWLGTALRRRAESTDCRDGFRLKMRIDTAEAVILKASRVARGFPADRAHCLRELGIIASMRGETRSAIRLLRRSIAEARQCVQPAEELESLRVLQSLHRLDPDFFGPLLPAQQNRLDELGQLHESSAGKDRSAEEVPTNLSLADRFVTVLQSGRRIAQALSADVVYAEASQAARKLLRGQHVDVITVRREHGEFSFQPLDQEHSDDSSRERLADFQALIKVAHTRGRAVCDASAEVTLPDRGSALATPIAFRGDHVAVILVTHDELSELFGNDELRIAEFVSTLAGAALENADGFLRLQQLNDTLEQRVLERTHAAEERARQLAVSNEQLRATEDQLREAIVHANSASEAKSRFLATISHEIRTPLNGILGMTRLARDCCDDGRQANYLDTVQESGQSLLALINDLLDLSKLEAGKLELEQIALDPTRLAAEIARLMAASAWQKGVELVCDIDPRVPQKMTGDPSRLRQVIMNLVGNAIKFTEQGFIAIVIRVVGQDGFPTHLSIAVQDSGIGIPADKQEKVFDSFSQADSSTTRRYGGTGLGLAICRELCEMMGGTIAIQSQPAYGSEFTVQIPLDGETEFRRLQPTLIDRRIAIIDPLAASRRAAVTALVPLGAAVSEFDDPNELDEFINQDWDLVVFGCTEVESITNHCAEANIPCLCLLPAHAEIPKRRHPDVKELRKPALAIDIIEAVETLVLGTATNIISQQSLLTALPHNVEPTGKPNQDLTGYPSGTDHSQHVAADLDIAIDASDIRILVAEDGMINQEVIVGILEMRGYQVDVAMDGQQAVERALQAAYDLCLMDVDMPKMDGLEATKRIREQSGQHHNSGMPIVAMTAHAGNDISRRCLDCGMNAYLTKPINPDALFATIQRFTRQAN